MSRNSSYFNKSDIEYCVRSALGLLHFRSREREEFFITNFLSVWDLDKSDTQMAQEFSEKFDSSFGVNIDEFLVYFRYYLSKMGDEKLLVEHLENTCI